MRRHRRWALTWVLGCVLAIAGIAVVPAVVVEAAKVEPQVAEPTVPVDFHWLVVSRCVGEEDDSFYVGGYSLGAPGDAPRVELWQWGDDDIPAPIPRDSPATTRVQACVDSYSYDIPVVQTRQPNETEMRIFARWVLDFATPCAASHGLELVEYEFPDGDETPELWRPYVQWNVSFAESQLQVDELLEIRRTCPPIPPILAASGIAW